MRNKSVFYLARHFLSGQKSKYIGRSHILTLAGITLGVIALLIVSSVMNGFRSDMQSRIIGTLSEIRILPKNGTTITDYSAILNTCAKMGFKAAPILRNELLLRLDDRIEPTMCFGVDYALQVGVSEVLKPLARAELDNAIQGLLLGFVDAEEFKRGGIVLGSGLAYRLNATIGDQIQILSPMFSEPTAFGLLPRIRSVKVLGIFAAGMPEYDSMYSYIPLETAFYFRGNSSGVDFIEVKTPDPRQLNKSVSLLANALPDNEIKDWGSFDPSLYNAIRFEKAMMFVIMLFMYIIASFNLTGNMMKTIAQKRKELGLLKAIGYSEKDLRLLFLLQSIVLSTLGIALGIVLALLLLGLQMQFDLVKLTISAGDFITLPVSIDMLDFLLVIGVAYLISIISILFPLRQLREIDTISLLRSNI